MGGPTPRFPPERPQAEPPDQRRRTLLGNTTLLLSAPGAGLPQAPGPHTAADSSGHEAHRAVPAACSPQSNKTGCGFITYNSLPLMGTEYNKISHVYLKETLQISVQN